MSQTQVHEKAPEGFCPQVEAAACYLEVDGKLLLLQRAANKSEPHTWGVPAGKVEKGEALDAAAKRELFEETGIEIPDASQLVYLRALYVRKPEIDYVYHLFKVHLPQIPKVRLSDEHEAYAWATAEEIEKMDLMAGAHAALQTYRSYFPKKRASSVVSSYLVLKRGNSVLLQLRKNTGYCDGMWGLVAGHVEEGEPATLGMVREAKEEIGIQIDPAHLKAFHVMHRRSNRANIDIFFLCNSWLGEIQNKEPRKCERVEFFPLDKLPENIMDYHETALKALETKEPYSEGGWD